MKKIMIIFIIVGIIFGLLNVHFILFDNSLKILKKDRLSLDYTFVDARGVKKLKILMNPVLIRAGIKDLVK
jgi:hypothetical protein